MYLGAPDCARQHCNDNLPCACCKTDIRGGRKGRTRGHHIVDQDDLPTSDEAAPVWAKCHSSCLITEPRLRIESILHRSRASSNKSVRDSAKIEPLAKGPDDFGRLVIASPQKAGPVNRDRHNHGIRAKERRYLVRQPACRCSGQIGPVTMLQGKNESPACITIDKRRASLCPWTNDLATLVAMVGDAVALTRKGCPAGVAGVTVNELNAPPARRAKRARTLHDFPAESALIRVERGNCPL